MYVPRMFGITRQTSVSILIDFSNNSLKFHESISIYKWDFSDNLPSPYSCIDLYGRSHVNTYKPTATSIYVVIKLYLSAWISYGHKWFWHQLVIYSDGTSKAKPRCWWTSDIENGQYRFWLDVPGSTSQLLLAVSKSFLL